jgi:hypothetical protein
MMIDSNPIFIRKKDTQIEVRLMDFFIFLQFLPSHCVFLHKNPAKISRKNTQSVVNLFKKLQSA